MAGHAKGAFVLVGLEAATGAGAAAAAAAAPLACFTMRGEAGSEAGPPYTAVPIRPAHKRRRAWHDGRVSRAGALQTWAYVTPLRASSCLPQARALLLLAHA